MHLQGLAVDSQVREREKKNTANKSHLEIPGRFQYQNGNTDKVSRSLREKKESLSAAEKICKVQRSLHYSVILPFPQTF